MATENKKERVQAHGMTNSQLKDLQLKQQDGTVEMVKGNKKTNDQRIPAEALMIPEHEQHMVHIYLQMPGTDDMTGRFNTVAKVVPYDVKAFQRAEAKGAFSNYAIAEIIHDPRSENQRKADNLDAAINGPVENHKIDKPLEEMNDAELRLTYAGLYKEEADSKMKTAELIDLIKEKQVFLSEEAADKQRAAEQEAADKTALKTAKK